MNAVRCILAYHSSETLEHRFAVCILALVELISMYY